VGSLHCLHCSHSARRSNGCPLRLPPLQVLGMSCPDIITLDGNRITGRGITSGSSFQVGHLTHPNTHVPHGVPAPTQYTHTIHKAWGRCAAYDLSCRPFTCPDAPSAPFPRIGTHPTPPSPTAPHPLQAPPLDKADFCFASSSLGQEDGGSAAARREAASLEECVELMRAREGAAAAAEDAGREADAAEERCGGEIAQLEAEVGELDAALALGAGGGADRAAAPVARQGGKRGRREEVAMQQEEEGAEVPDGQEEEEGGVRVGGGGRGEEGEGEGARQGGKKMRRLVKAGEMNR
jgi:hypothetical protein